MRPAAEHLFETAVMALRRSDLDLAMSAVTQVLVLDPRHADAWAMRARLEARAGRPFNAMLHHGFSTQLAPQRWDMWLNRGIDAMAARMYQESEESFKRSLAIEETYEGHFDYANLLSELMRIDEAVEHFKRALEIGGIANDQIHANLGISLLAQGNWREGFQRFRHRFNAPGFPPRPRFDYPIWHGEPLEGKTILAYAEQGFGDEILSYRFAKWLKEAGARVIVSARPPMFRLARSLEGKLADAVILQYDPPPWPPDYMTALLDIPAWMDISPPDVDIGRYLFAEDRGYKLDFGRDYTVGICWASGNRELQPEVLETAKKKSIALQQLLPLKRNGVMLINLQKEHKERDTLREHGVKDTMAGATDFMDTAWIIDQLDLIITVDTSVAHLAGALGKPVWNLVRFDGQWPWMRETEKTCWYSSMTIYRQPKPLDWGNPLARLMADFETKHFVDRSRELRVLGAA